MRVSPYRSVLFAALACLGASTAMAEESQPSFTSQFFGKQYQVDASKFDLVVAIPLRSGGDVGLIPEAGDIGKYDIVMCNTSGTDGNYKVPGRALPILAGSCVALYGVTFVQANTGSSNWSGVAFIRPHAAAR